MGIGGISVWQLLIILVIVMLLFGTKKLRNIGSDLGGAIKSFRNSMREGEKEESEDKPQIQGEAGQNKPIEGSAAKDAKNPWDSHSNVEKKV